MRNVNKMFVTVTAGKRLILRSEQRWEDNIQMYLKEMQYEKADDSNMCGIKFITSYCIRTYIHTYIRTYIHSYIRTYIIHTFIHTYVHTYIHTYVHT
jgi:hypothetical protein